MPPVFGGAPTCPTCHDKVYFAEQTLGPGGRAFHKICLKCVSCGKLLEPRLLVDHDGQAYCKACHGKSFGTKGYGAGGALVGEYQPRLSPTRPLPTTPTIASGNSPAASPVRPPAPAFSPTPTSSRPPLPPKPSFNRPSDASEEASHSRTTYPAPPPAANPPLPSRPSFGSQARSGFDLTEPTVAPTTGSLATPVPEPGTGNGTSHSTPAFSDDEDDSASTAPSSRRRPPLPFPPSQFAPKSLSSSGDLCRRCGTQVYFAEQVIAVGSKWHKRCLRCASCSTTLNSHLLEKDRLPYCKKCYQENFGTASLGMTSRPTLY